MKNNAFLSIFYFILLVLYIVGVVGGVVAMLCTKYWLLAAAIAFVGYMAFPKAEEYFHKMMGLEKGQE